MSAIAPSSGSATQPVRSLAGIDEPAVRGALEEYLADRATLGLLLCGSRALGWADPDGDYDVLIVVTRERLRALAPEATLIRQYAEGEMPRRMIGDYSIFSEETFEEELRSPLDIDHWPYVDAVVLTDRVGTLELWRRRLAAFPEDTWKERAMNKLIQLVVATHNATVADVRGFAAARQIDLYRAALAGVHLWFTLQKRWAPPLKWWSREVDRLSIRPDTRAVLEGSILNPSVEMLAHLREHMKTELRHAGVAEVDDVVGAFARSFLPERRPAVYRDSYL